MVEDLETASAPGQLISVCTVSTWEQERGTRLKNRSSQRPRCFSAQLGRLLRGAIQDRRLSRRQSVISIVNLTRIEFSPILIRPGQILGVTSEEKRRNAYILTAGDSALDLV